MRISPLKKETKQSSSPPASTPSRDDAASHGENGIDPPTKRDPTHSQRTVAFLEEEIKEYEKRVMELERELIFLQLKVRELEAKDTSHLACKVEAQWLRRDKEAAEALAASYKQQLILANELIIPRTPSQGSGKKRREGPEEDEGSNSNSKRQKPQATDGRVER